MKKILLIFLCLVMAVSVIGCGDEKEQNATTDKATTGNNEPSSSDEGVNDNNNITVKKEGKVNESTYKKAVTAFEDIVNKLRTDGVVGEDDICVIMDDTGIKVNITFADDSSDIELIKKDDVYLLILDYDFTWLEGFGEKINDIDPASYNKELLLAILKTISDEPQVIFDRIDMDYHSAAGLSDTEWTEVGDCLIISDDMKVDEYISYKIKTSNQNNNETADEETKETTSDGQSDQTINDNTEKETVSGNVSDTPVIDTNVSQTEVQKEIKKTVSSIITQDMSELEKVLIIHDYITYNVDYDYANYLNNTVPNTSCTAYGTLKTGRAICSGYALLFYEMAKGAGLEVTYVSGDADNGSGQGPQGHAWNQVRVDNVWYNIDTCWDDPTNIDKKKDDHSMNGYNYCLISDSLMYKDHTVYGTEHHKCNKTIDVAAFAKALAKVNRYSTMVYAENESKIESLVNKMVSEGKNEFTILMINDGVDYWDSIDVALAKTKKPLHVSSSNNSGTIIKHNICIKENVYCVDSKSNIKSIIDAYIGKLDKLELWYYDDNMNDDNAWMLINQVLYNTGYNVELYSKTDVKAGRSKCHIYEPDNVLNVSDLSELVTYAGNNGIEALKNKYIWYKTNNTIMNIFTNKLRESFISSGYLVDYDCKDYSDAGYTNVIKFTMTDFRQVKYIGSSSELLSYANSIGMNNLVGKEIYIKNSQLDDPFAVAYEMFYEVQIPVNISTILDWGSVVGVEIDGINSNEYISIDAADLKADIIDAKNKGIATEVRFRLPDRNGTYNRDSVTKMIADMNLGFQLFSYWYNEGNCHYIELWYS